MGLLSLTLARPYLERMASRRTINLSLILLKHLLRPLRRQKRARLGASIGQNATSQQRSVSTIIPLRSASISPSAHMAISVSISIQRSLASMVMHALGLTVPTNIAVIDKTCWCLSLCWWWQQEWQLKDSMGLPHLANSVCQTLRCSWISELASKLILRSLKHSPLLPIKLLNLKASQMHQRIRALAWLKPLQQLIKQSKKFESESQIPDKSKNQKWQLIQIDRKKEAEWYDRLERSSLNPP